MKKQIFMIIIGLSLFFSTFINAAIVHYYPWEGDKYGRRFCRDYNYAEYLCYDPQKPDRCEQTGRTDCANFVSQALIYGGISFSSCDINANYNICDNNGNCYCDKPKDLVMGASDIGIWEEILGLINAIDLPKVLHRSYCFYEYKHRQEEPGDVAILIPNHITGCAGLLGMIS